MAETQSLRNSGVTIQSVLEPATATRSKSKVVATIGPACWSVETLVKLIDAGVDTCRLNFSHGDHETHANTLANIRAAAAQRPGRHIAVMLDTKGPEIRTGTLAGGVPIELKKGSIVEIGTDYDFEGTAEKIACSYPALPTSVKIGGQVLCADGSLTMRVVEIRDTSIMVEMLNTGMLGEKKNMNLPGCKVDLPTVTPKDIDDIQNFGVVHGVDFVAASFVRKAADIKTLREILGTRGRSIQISTFHALARLVSSRLVSPAAACFVWTPLTSFAHSCSVTLPFLPVSREDREPGGAREFRRDFGGHRWRHGGSGRPRHGAPARKGLPRAKTHDQEMQRRRETCHHGDADAGVHDQGAAPHARRVHRRRKRHPRKSLLLVGPPLSSESHH